MSEGGIVVQRDACRSMLLVVGVECIWLDWREFQDLAPVPALALGPGLCRMCRRRSATSLVSGPLNLGCVGLEQVRQWFEASLKAEPYANRPRCVRQRSGE